MNRKKLKKIKQFMAMFLCVLMVTRVVMPAMATVVTASGSDAEEPTQHIVLNTEPETSEAAIESQTSIQDSTEPSEPESSAQDPVDPSEPESSAQVATDPSEPESSAQDPAEPTDPSEPESSAQDATDPSEPESSAQDPVEPTDPSEPESNAQDSVDPTEPSEQETSVATPTDATCKDCGEAPCICKVCEICGEKNCDEHVPNTAEGLKVGDSIWIKRGSLTYKSADLTSESREVWFNYETKIVDIITDENGNATWYEFEPTGLLWLVREFKYVNVENTSVENPDSVPEDPHACTCGESAPENLADHTDSCPRKQYVKSLFEGKTAEEIYAEWDEFDEDTQVDILDMLQEYNKSVYDELNELVAKELYPTVVELEDGTTVSVDSIPENARLTVTVPNTEKSQTVDFIADNVFAIDSSVAHGGVLSLNYDIKIMQGEDEWQPEDGESVHVTIEVPDFHLDYRTYLQGIHVLDTVEAICAAVESGDAISMTEIGLAESFPTETAAAEAAGFPENTIVYTIMLPETGDMFVENGNIVINATSFSTRNITAFNVDNSAHSGEVEDVGLKLDKVAVVNPETGVGHIELSSYVKGEVSNTPTDVVMVIDQSGSMWTAVDPDSATTKLSDLDTKKGARRGYYVAYDLDTLADGVDNGNPVQKGEARLVRYKNGVWQVTEPFSATIYDYDKDGNKKFVGFVNTCSYDTEEEWKQISNEANYIYAVSISGSLYESLNIFMDEMENAVDCRVAICTFAGTIIGEGKTQTEKNQEIWRKNSSTDGSTLDPEKDYNGSGIFIDGTLTWDSTVQTLTMNSNDDTVLDDYENAFEDPSTAEGQRILYDTIEKINTDYGNTPTALGILYARRLFNEGGRAGANQVAIVFTDGIPSPAHLGTRAEHSCKHKLSDYALGDTYKADVLECDFCDLVTTYDSQKKEKGYAIRTTYADQAQRLRNQGATVYSIGPKAGRAGVDVLETIATSKDHYFNASGDDIAKVFRDIAQFVVSSSQEVNESSRSIDYISDSFKLPDDANENAIEVYTAKYAGMENGEDIFAEDEKEEFTTAKIEVTDKMVSVSGFDYEGNAVGMEGTDPIGKKLIIRIPIEKEPDFLGGDNVYTNKSTSGIYNGEIVADYFPEPIADVNVRQLTPNLTDTHVYLSQTAEMPHIANIGKFTVEGTEYSVDGRNNAYVNIIYTVMGPDNYEYEYTIPAGTAYAQMPAFGENAYKVLTEDTEFTITYKVVSVANEENKSFREDTAVTRVYKPIITFQDSVINLGETADYTDNLVLNTVENQGGVGTNVVWKNTAGMVATIEAMGMAPTLQYVYSIEADAFKKDQSVMVANVISPVNNQLNHRVPVEMDITQYVTFYRGNCEFRLCGHVHAPVDTTSSETWVNFIVHLNNFDLLIKKTGANVRLDPDQTFVFKVTGPEDFSMEVTIKGNGETKVMSLPAGEIPYEVTELTDWSWRYEIDDNDTVKKEVNMETSEDGVVTVTFANKRTETKWLSGDSYCANWWGGVDGTVSKREIKKVISNNS